MKLKIEIEFGNALMLRYSQALEALESSLIAFGAVRCPKIGEKFGINDYNGNTVGKWEVVDDTPVGTERIGE
jgi:hypothetical protein